MVHALAGRRRRLTRAAAYAVAVALLLAVLVLLIQGQFAPLARADDRAVAEATAVTRRHDRLRDFLVVWQEVSRPVYAYLALAVPGCLWASRRYGLRTRAWWAFLTMMTGWALAAVLKPLVQRARPVLEDPVSQAAGYSFPSGHASSAAILATALVALFWPVLSRSGRWLALAGAAGWVLLACLDRVFLGVHYPSDVVGGVAFGSGLVLASYAGYVDWSPPAAVAPPEPTGGGQSRA